MEDTKLTVRFWGVRGSLPSPGPDTALVGGNTSCVEVTTPTTRVVLDAGSGLRALGDALVARGEHRDTTLLLSHEHRDHVMGIPFFAPLYMPGCNVTFVSGGHGAPLRDVLARQMTPPMFPVAFGSLPSRVVCRELAPAERLTVGDLEIETATLNHPDPVYAFRLSSGGKSVVFATDTEHFACVDPRLLRLARGADLLIYDAQYTPEEYAGELGPPRTGWGHSTFAAGVELARAAGVGTLALFHHDPRRTDAGVAEIVQRARASFPDTVAAREGLTVEVGAAVRSRAA